MIKMKLPPTMKNRMQSVKSLLRLMSWRPSHASMLVVAAKMQHFLRLSEPFGINNAIVHHFPIRKRFLASIGTKMMYKRINLRFSKQNGDSLM